jgi:asparagine synthase (glutamine-hydrolysing)
MAVSPAGWDSAFAAAAPLLPARFRTATPGGKVHKVAASMFAESPDALYRSLMTHWRDPEAITSATPPTTVLTHNVGLPSFDGVVNRMRYFDLVSELPDDILVKVDRATMAVSLESRAPFLHPDVVEFAWRIPPAQQVRDGQGKWLLRQVLYKYVPRELIERPKMGFGVPIASWLRGPLREWADALISEDRLRRDGYLAPGPIRQAWDEHQAGVTDNSHLLWGVLMFQAWLQTQ